MKPVSNTELENSAMLQSRRGLWAIWLGFVLVIILLVLLMAQVDRQWQRMSDMQRTMQEQAEDLRRASGLLRELEQGLRSGSLASPSLASPSSAQAAAQQPGELKDMPAFARARAAAAQADYASGDWLIRSFSTGLKTLTPLVSTDAYATDVQSYVLESLLTRDPDTLTWEGLLAEDWRISEDGMHITFTLRRGVTFSDGKPMTAKDVAFTFGFIMNEKIAAPRHRAYYAKIASVTAVDDYHVEFVFAEPYFNSMALAGGMEVLPEHFYRRFLDEPRKFNESRGLLLGTGPYRMSDPEGWTPDQGRIELERNPRYWGPVDPSFDRVVWRIIENDTAQLTSFRNGEIDIYSAPPREYEQLKEDKELGKRAQHFEYTSPSAGYSFIAWNQQKNGKPTLFADARVRQAMLYLTDVQAVIDDVLLGYGMQAVSPFTPTSPQHDASLLPVSYNLDRAVALLKEAGFESRSDNGILTDASGKPFEFELIYFQKNEDSRRIALFLRDVYARAGVVMKPTPLEWSMMLDRMQHKNLDAIMLGWTSGIEVDIFQMFHSSQAVEGGDNFISYRNPELDRLIDAARAEVVESKRMPLWQQAERVIVADQPYAFLMRRQSLVFADRRIHNLKVSPMGLNLTWMPLEVYVPAALQRKR